MQNEILIKAKELFLNHGFKSVTMDDLAKELGMSKKTIYQFYQDKTALVSAVTDHLFEHISTGISRICDGEKNPIEEMFAIKEFSRSALQDEKSSPHYQLQRYYPKIFTVLVCKQFQTIQDCTQNNLKRGIELGLYRPDIDLAFVTRIFFAGFNAVRHEELFPSENFDKNKLFNLHLAYHLRGIATPKGVEIIDQITAQS
jgi:AcrR family transcriptional regulator